MQDRSCLCQQVRVRSKGGAVHVGLLVRKSGSRVVLRVADDDLPLVVDADEVQSMTLPPLHLTHEDDRRSVLGGVGRHTRRHMYADDGTGSVGVLVGPVDSEEDLQRLRDMVDSLPHTAFATEPPEACDGNLYCLLVDAARIPSLSIHLSYMGLVVYSPKSKTHVLMCDSLNRAPHLYAAQLPWVPLADVGPTRGMWRYRFHHEPRPFFSWPALARSVLDRLCPHSFLASQAVLQLPLPVAIIRARILCDRSDRVADLEAPLRHHVHRLLCARRGARRGVCERRAARLRGEEAAARAACAPAVERQRLGRSAAVAEDAARECAPEEPSARERGRDEYCVTPALDEVTSASALDAFQNYYYNDRLTDEERQVCKATLQHLPRVSGYMVHWTAMYVLNHKHVGWCRSTRTPVDLERAPPEVFNRMRREGASSITSTGKRPFPLYKGLFEPPTDVQVHRPKRQLQRSDEQEKQLLRPPVSLPRVENTITRR